MSNKKTAIDARVVIPAAPWLRRKENECASNAPQLRHVVRSNHHLTPRPSSHGWQHHQDISHPDNNPRTCSQPVLHSYFTVTVRHMMAAEAEVQIQAYAVQEDDADLGRAGSVNKKKTKQKTRELKEVLRMAPP